MNGVVVGSRMGHCTGSIVDMTSESHPYSESRVQVFRSSRPLQNLGCIPSTRFRQVWYLHAGEDIITSLYGEQEGNHDSNGKPGEQIENEQNTTDKLAVYLGA